MPGGAGSGAGRGVVRPSGVRRDGRRARRLAAVGGAVALLAATLAGAPGAAAVSAAGAGDDASYTNAVTEGYSIDFPDPAVIRAKDGYWYGYSTGGPYDEQDERSSPYKIAKSADLITWEDAGSVFDEDNRPSWATEETGFWAPDVRYLNGQYLLYFTVPDTTTSDDGSDPAIGVATAPTPEGPWKPSDEPLIPAQRDGDGWDSTIDPALFTDDDGTHYLYWGGYGTGDYVVELDATGTKVVGEPTKVATSRYEGPYVMKRDGYYYLFASSANCCAGPTTGYAVFVGRSKSPTGPFVDKLGTSLLDSRTGGTPVIAQNGNRWIGAGHHSAATDLAGQTWMAYHAVDRADPWLDTSPGFTMRGMNIDRLDWIDGWPIVRAGAGPSAEKEAAPVTTAEVDERFEERGRTLVPIRGRLESAGPDEHSGGFGELSGRRALAVSKRRVSHADARVEADVRTGSATGGAVGVVSRYRSPLHNLRAYVDAGRGELRVEARAGSDVRRASAPLPEGYDASAWHTVAMQVRGGEVEVDVTDSRQSDPWASVTLDVPASLAKSGRAGVVADRGGEVDNVAAQPLYEPVTEREPTPEPGAVDAAYSDDFDSALGEDWGWVRKDPEARVAGGVLVWPTQDGDLVGEGGDGAGALLRNAPEGEYTVETKLSIDTGVDTRRNFQQGGLIVYDGDDEFLRSDVVAVGDTRIVEFGKETVFQDRLEWGAGLLGTPDETTWLRLHHTVDPETGEHRFRGASSTDGENWTWGGTWTMAADSAPRIGLVSQGSTPEVNEEHGRATSTFDYFNVSRP